MESGPPEQTQGPKVPARVLDAAAEAYYSRAAASADAARGRAQTAFSMASVIAGALGAAGALGHIGDAAAAVQIAGTLAFAAWLGTAWLLLRAAVGEYVPPDMAQLGERGSGVSFVQEDRGFVDRILRAFVTNAM